MLLLLFPCKSCYYYTQITTTFENNRLKPTILVVLASRSDYQLLAQHYFLYIIPMHQCCCRQLHARQCELS